MNGKFIVKCLILVFMSFLMFLLYNELGSELKLNFNVLLVLFFFKCIMILFFFLSYFYGSLV